MGRLTNIKQGTEQWFMARAGLVTSSGVAAAMTRDRSRAEGTFGQTAHTYALELAAERWGGSEEAIQTAAMERGSSLEDAALDAYEGRTLNMVRRGQFWVHETLACAASPDGLVSDGDGTGVVEVKCMGLAKHASCILSKQPPSEYIPQMVHELWLTGADYVDFVSYHPGAPEDRRVCVLRITRDNKLVTEHSMRVMQFIEIVDRYAAGLGVAHWQPFHLEHPDA